MVPNYFHDWTRQSNRQTAKIHGYVIGGWSQRTNEKRKKNGGGGKDNREDLPRSNRSPLENSGPDTWRSNSPSRRNCRPVWHRPESAPLSTTSLSTLDLQLEYFQSPMFLFRVTRAPNQPVEMLASMDVVDRDRQPFNENIFHVARSRYEMWSFETKNARPIERSVRNHWCGW